MAKFACFLGPEVAEQLATTDIPSQVGSIIAREFDWNKVEQGGQNIFSDLYVMRCDDLPAWAGRYVALGLGAENDFVQDGAMVLVVDVDVD